MKQVFMKLHDQYERHLGHCQVTYVSKNNEGQKIVYCLQWQGDKWTPQVRLMRCSQDGEPSHEVAFSDVQAVFEVPTGGSRTERAVSVWIEKYEEVES